jgi:amino acid transporter
MSIIEIECFFIILLTIPILFKIKDWSYRKQKLETIKSEEYAFLLIMFTSLFSYGYIVKQEFFTIISMAFFYWLLYDIILFDIKLWKEFLGIIKRR